MSGRGRDKEEDPADEKEEADQEAQETQQPLRILPGFCPVSAEVGPGRVHHRDPEPPPKTREPQPPSTSRTAEPAYQELGVEPLLGGAGLQEEGRVEEGPERERREEKQEAEPLEAEPSPPFALWEYPSPGREPLEEHYTTNEPVVEEREKPPDQKGAQNSDDGEYRSDKPLRPVRNERQEREKKDEQGRKTGGGPVREQGRDRELARPPREEVLDRNNTFCRPCWINFGERMPFLEHYLLVHQRKLQTKNGGRIPSPSPQRRSPSCPQTPEPEVSDRSRGRQLGRPEPAAPGQLRG